MAPAAQHIADRPFHIIYRHIVTEGGLRGCQADLMQLRLDGKDLNALVLEPGRIVARLDRNGIGQRLPVGQVMEKQRRFMGKNCLRTAKMQQIHGVHPGVFGKINPMRRLFQPTRLHELIKNRF